MILSKTIHLDEDAKLGISGDTSITINHKSGLEVIPLQIEQGEDSVWLGKEQAQALYELLHEELGHGEAKGLLA